MAVSLGILGSTVYVFICIETFHKSVSLAVQNIVHTAPVKFSTVLKI